MYRFSADCPNCQHEVGMPYGFKGMKFHFWTLSISRRVDVACPSCGYEFQLVMEGKRGWVSRIGALFIYAVLILAAVMFVREKVNAAELFVVDNYACGTTLDWNASKLPWPSIVVKDVKFTYGEDPETKRKVAFTVDNRKSSRLPVHVHWVVRAEIDGNLVAVGATSSDFQLKLMKPGDNRFVMDLHPIVKSEAKEFYGCLGVSYEE